MEKSEDELFSMHFYLLKKVREKSGPASLCAPLVMFKLKDYCTCNNIAQTQSIKKSVSMDLLTKPLAGLWLALSSKLCTAARCSTSNSYADTRPEDYTIGALHEDEDEDWDSGLPGMRRRRQTNRASSKNSAVTDMQVNQQIELETGLQRLREMYSLGPDWMFVQEDTRTITTIFYRSVMLGFLLNVVKAAQAESKSSKNKNISPSQAVMKMGTNSMSDSTRVIKEAARGSVRLTAFAASLLYLSQSIAAYRNQSSVWEYSISTAVAMACAGFGKPPRTFTLSVLGGAIAGALGGSLVCSMLSSVGASQEQRTLNRIRQKLGQQQQQQTLTIDDGVI
ncbi:hypothetical protein EGW08_015126 [Elysia chlorotica]|uniref:Complex I assembly factor TIMMDC1, mitochondrial n=1 Tax=Elysia chlorotica TaxID=188477 RepID=A0A3S1B7S7_ELYCH|nr:hypothetical protein EGW08_015126 [Elysia chlorotica]